MKRPVVLVGVFIALIVLALGLNALVEERRSVREINDLQASVREARDSVNTCQAELGVEEASFRVFAAHVDSLRGAVHTMEALDQGGVPGDRYDEYLTLFDEYNASVEEWEAQRANLRDREARCRDLVVEHNSRVDSLRSLAEEKGLAIP